MNKIKTLIITALAGVLAVLFFSTAAVAGKVVFSDKKMALNTSASWATKDHDDPNVVLYAVKGKANFVVTAMEEKTQDRYLKLKIEDEIADLYLNNLKPSKMKTMGTLAKAYIYYVEYYSYPDYVITGYFNYGDATYMVQSYNIRGGEFAGIFSTLRNPSMVWEPKKPAAPKNDEYDVKPIGDISMELKPALEFTSDKEYQKVVAQHKASGIVEHQTSSSTAVNLFEDPELKAAQERAAQAAAAAQSQPQEKTVMPTDIAEKVKHTPVNMYVLLGVVALWLGLSALVNITSRKAVYPSLAGYGNNVPEDFFFPFSLVTRTTMQGIKSEITSKKQQTLEGLFLNKMLPLISCGLVILIAYEALLSASIIFKFEYQLGALFQKLPYYEYMFFAPYALGALFALIGMLASLSTKKELAITINNDVSVSTDTVKNSVALNDGSGKLLAKMTKVSNGKWQCVFPDDKPMFDVVDMNPSFRVFRLLLGDPFGLGGIRPRYSIVIEGKLAGFVFNDASSGKDSKIYADPAFARSLHPLIALATVMYAQNSEPLRRYPCLF